MLDHFIVHLIRFASLIVIRTFIGPHWAEHDYFSLPRRLRFLFVCLCVNKITQNLPGQFSWKLEESDKCSHFKDPFRAKSRPTDFSLKIWFKVRLRVKIKIRIRNVVALVRVRNVTQCSELIETRLGVKECMCMVIFPNNLSYSIKSAINCNLTS